MHQKVPRAFRPGMNNAFYFIRNALYRKISQYAPQLTGKMMDFGCGSKPYQSLFTGVTEYIGVDYAGEGHSHENESIDVYYDGKKLPFTDGYFDSVFTSEVFEHIFNLEEMLPEISRVMKHDAKILITCPFVWPEHEVPVDFARYTRFALKHLLEKHGFSIITIDKSGDFMMAINQMRMVYFNEHFIPSFPLLGKWKFFRTNIPALLNPVMNGWFSLKNRILPHSSRWYLNNIILAKKN